MQTRGRNGLRYSCRERTEVPRTFSTSLVILSTLTAVAYIAVTERIKLISLITRRQSLLFQLILSLSLFLSLSHLSFSISLSPSLSLSLSPPLFLYLPLPLSFYRSLSLSFSISLSLFLYFSLSLSQSLRLLVYLILNSSLFQTSISVLSSFPSGLESPWDLEDHTLLS